jgi:hypothetical protein
VAYDVCEAFAARADEMPWEDGAYKGVGQIFRETGPTPMDVPLHPGVERWLLDHAGRL